jgi:DNA-binding NarL/FixJ family response regulator
MPVSVPIRVAIIDDDRSLLDGLRQIIDGAEEFFCAGAFGSIEDALPILATIQPDVLLLDIQLPGIPGHQSIKALHAACPKVEILMLTVFSDREKVFTSICNGASGYLLKTTPPAKLLDSIRAARDGGSPMSPEIARQIVNHFQRTGSTLDRPDSLTSAEKRLLAFLAEGYSYQSAADRMCVSVNTVRNYIRNIYEKLHVHSKSEAVSKALRRGLI